jgi:hypothetical protein
LHFSRKCADRPFENIVSIVRKIPWHSREFAPLLMHRDHIFELMKSTLSFLSWLTCQVGIDLLSTHLRKQYYHVSETLMIRLVRAGILCEGFTERQKRVLLDCAVCCLVVIS